jgi:hypothetical protein
LLSLKTTVFFKSYPYIDFLALLLSFNDNCAKRVKSNIAEPHNFYWALALDSILTLLVPTIKQAKIFQNKQKLPVPQILVLKYFFFH